MTAVALSSAALRARALIVEAAREAYGAPTYRFRCRVCRAEGDEPWIAECDGACETDGRS